MQTKPTNHQQNKRETTKLDMTFIKGKMATFPSRESVPRNKEKGNHTIFFLRFFFDVDHFQSLY